MKKISKITLALSALLVPFTTKAQGLIDSGNLRNVSDEFADGAGFSNIGIGTIAATLISIVLSMLGLIFLVLTIMAGFKWMNAGGNEEDVKKAQTSLKNSVIGLIIILAAYTITYFLFNNLPFSGGGSIMPAPIPG